MNINVYSEFFAVPKFEKWYVGFNTFRLAFKHKINTNTVIVYIMCLFQIITSNN